MAWALFGLSIIFFYLLVGAYAMAVHGYPRSTMDIDLWVMPDPENAQFEDAFANSAIIDIEGITVNVLSVPDLLKNKRSTGRTKDIADAESLEESD
jgi:hypothetical protein